MFKRARSQYSSAYNSSMVSSMWAAGKWMAANQTIKQEKGPGGGGGMMSEETNPATTTSSVSPVNSPAYPASFPENLPFPNYDGSTNMSSMASNAYAASLNSSSGKKIDGSTQPRTCEIYSF